MTEQEISSRGGTNNAFARCSPITRTKPRTSNSPRLKPPGKPREATMMAVPTELVSEVRALIARKHLAEENRQLILEKWHEHLG